MIKFLAIHNPILTGKPIMQNYILSTPETVSKVVKIPWRMYKFINNIDNRKKAVKNAMIIGEAIRQWWNSSTDNVGRVKLKGINETYMIYMNLIIEKVPFLTPKNNNADNIFSNLIAVLPIATFEPRDLSDIDDNDFVFSGTMKISKTDPEEIISVVIGGIDIVAGKYQMQE